ncbi:MAG: DUF4402 domain-containing protein [Colwellia sp.]|nr:DUF4402 domain-containing protein [Colwellia sp.]
MLPVIKQKLFATTLAIIGLITAFPSLAIPEWISQKQSLHFGVVIPIIGSCSLDPTTSVVTSPGNICLGPGSRGHYQIYGDANQMLEVTLNQVFDIPEGINFNPVGRLVNNLGDDMTAPIAGIKTRIRIGSDGILDVYVGGSLNLSQPKNSATPYIVQYDIEFIKG